MARSGSFAGAFALSSPIIASQDEMTGRLYGASAQEIGGTFYTTVIAGASA